MPNLNQAPSVLKLIDFYFAKFDFVRNEKYRISLSEYDSNLLSVSLGKESGYTENKLTLNIYIKVNLPDGFDLNLCATGKFQCEGNDSAEKLIKYEKNAVAIMFPYIRSQITLLTSQPNLNPVILPPININALFQKIEESKTE